MYQTLSNKNLLIQQITSLDKQVPNDKIRLVDKYNIF